MKITYLIFCLFTWASASAANLSCVDESSTDPIAAIVAPMGRISRIGMRPEYCEAIKYCYGFTERTRYMFNSKTHICEYPEHILKYAKQRSKDKGVGSCGLTDEELFAVDFYSSYGYECMNAYARYGSFNKASEGTKLLNEVLDSALKKLPDYQGFVRRGADLPLEILKEHSVGSKVTYKSFTSTSTGAGFNSPHMFLIYSKTGKPIMNFTGDSSEGEVLFKTNAQFKVLRKTIAGDKTYFVMREVDASETEKDATTLDQQVLSLIPKTSSDFGKKDSWKCGSEELSVEKTVKQTNIPPRAELFN